MSVFKSIIILTLLITTLNAQLKSSRNSNWWDSLDDDKKYDYLVGFLDGMDLGVYFSYRNLKENKGNEQIIKFIIESYNKNKKKYFNDLTYRQIIEGMDNFYLELENKSIKPRVAIYIVLLKTSGVGQKDIDEATKYLNKLKE